MRIIGDEEVRAAPVAVVVDAAREALLQFGRGELAAPPRTRSELGSFDYVYTAGALADGTSGFRAYRAGQPAGDQLVAVWDSEGRLTGLVVGDELGARRTGALGAVAADALARPDAATVGLVGTGQQAWTQLWALTAIRDIDRVRVYSPNPRHRRDFAARAQAELGVETSPVDGAAAAVRGADIVVLATRSTTPVIASADVDPGVHLTTVGPKTQDAHETPPELAAAAAVLTCDAPQQAAAYAEPFFTGTTPLASLADVLLGLAPGRQHSNDITMHCSVGLAGSEILLARRLLNGHTGE